MFHNLRTETIHECPYTPLRAHTRIITELLPTPSVLLTRIVRARFSRIYNASMRSCGQQHFTTTDRNPNPKPTPILALTLVVWNTLCRRWHDSEELNFDTSRFTAVCSAKDWFRNSPCAISPGGDTAQWVRDRKGHANCANGNRDDTTENRLHLMCVWSLGT